MVLHEGWSGLKPLIPVGATRIMISKLCQL